MLSFLAAALIAFAGIAAYSNSFTVPFVFDDGYVTTSNPSIRQLWPIWEPLSPPGDLTIGGRPLLNLSFALNYAISGFRVGSYHAVNLLIHVLAGLTLFGIARRTLRQPVLRERFGKDAWLLALAIALLWTVHPLQTESVTYISQRAESLMGLFYLLTLYCFIRATEPAHRTLWSVLCVIACLLGMATKEVMATAPLVMLLYDRTFVAGTFREAWQQRARLYRGLVATWLLLGWLLLDVGKRSVGLGLGVSPLAYAMTQCGALIHYMVLVIWPHPLVIDYGTMMVSDPVKVLPQAVAVLALLAATAWAFWRRPVLGFAGLWFFIILAPTSSVIPMVLEPVAEHRLYLPLAALMTLLVLGLYRGIGAGSFPVILALVIVWGTLTFLRNEDYHSALQLWRQTALDCPDNPRARNNYGDCLLQSGEVASAIEQFQAAVKLKPDYPEAQANWGNALIQQGHVAEAIGHYQEAVKINPASATAQNNWGNAVRREGRPTEAIEHYREAIWLDPLYVDAQYNWGSLLLGLGKFSEAAEHYEEAVRLRPDDPESHNNLGVVLARLGRKPEAMAEFQKALQLDPDYTPASDNLARLKSSTK